MSARRQWTHSRSQIMHRIILNPLFRGVVAVLFAAIGGSVDGGEKEAKLTLSWSNNFLTIHGADLPQRQVKVQYLEAYCRPGSTDRDWGKTVIKHKTELLSRSTDGKSLRLRCTLADGVVVSHDITAGAGEGAILLVSP